MYGIAQKKRTVFLLPTPRVAAIADWDERIRQSVTEAWTERLGTMLGVPAYLCRFLDEAVAQARWKPLRDIWPMLGRIYYSGTPIDPYRDQLERVLGRSLIFRGLYTATEGSLGAELDPRSPGELHLMVDMNVFSFDGERLAIAAYSIGSIGVGGKDPRFFPAGVQLALG